jgi:hypothetical protein
LCVGVGGDRTHAASPGGAEYARPRQLGTHMQNMFNGKLYVIKNGKLLKHPKLQFALADFAIFSHNPFCKLQAEFHDDSDRRTQKNTNL